MVLNGLVIWKGITDLSVCQSFLFSKDNFLFCLKLPKLVFADLSDLDVHLDDGLSDQGRSEEGPEGDQEVAAGDAGQVEQGIGNLKKKHKNETIIIKIFC